MAGTLYTAVTANCGVGCVVELQRVQRCVRLRLFVRALSVHSRVTFAALCCVCVCLCAGGPKSFVAERLQKTLPPASCAARSEEVALRVAVFSSSRAAVDFFQRVHHTRSRTQQGLLLFTRSCGVFAK